MPPPGETQSRPIRRTNGEADHEPRGHVLHSRVQYRAAHRAREGEAGQDDDSGHSPTYEKDPHGTLTGRDPSFIPGPGCQDYRHHSH